MSQSPCKEMSFVIDVASSSKIGFGEGPHWSPKENSLYYVNCLANSFVKLNCDGTKEQREVKLKDCKSAFVSTIFPVVGKTGSFIVAAGDVIVEFQSDAQSPLTGDLKEIAKISEGHFNDGKCDENGRLWIGAWKEKPNAKSAFEYEANLGGLCSLTAGNFKREWYGLSGSNGICFSPDNKIIYTVDSMESNIGAQGFDLSTGQVSEQRNIVYNLDREKLGIDSKAILDGLVVDVKGNLWVVIYLAGKVFNIDVGTGKIINEIQFEPPLVTSLCFGGKQLNKLFVTSCFEVLPELSEHAQVGELGGHTFRVTCEKDNSFKGFAPYDYIC